MAKITLRPQSPFDKQWLRAPEDRHLGVGPRDEWGIDLIINFPQIVCLGEAGDQCVYMLGVEVTAVAPSEDHFNNMIQNLVLRVRIPASDIIRSVDLSPGTGDRRGRIRKHVLQSGMMTGSQIFAPHGAEVVHQFPSTINTRLSEPIVMRAPVPLHILGTLELTTMADCITAFGVGSSEFGWELRWQGLPGETFIHQFVAVLRGPWSTMIHLSAYAYAVLSNGMEMVTMDGWLDESKYPIIDRSQ